MGKQYGRHGYQVSVYVCIIFLHRLASFRCFVSIFLEFEEVHNVEVIIMAWVALGKSFHLCRLKNHKNSKPQPEKKTFSPTEELSLIHI